MNQSELYAAMTNFLHLIDHGEGTIDQNEKALKIALDRLAFVSHSDSVIIDKTEYHDSPRQDHVSLRKQIESLFPNYGYYNSVEERTNDINETTVVVGDAIDDILDITLELRDLVWRWHHNSVTDALWHFQLSFQTHWGEHLRELQLYLYSLDRGL